MRPQPVTIRMILNAQMGKQGPPMDGKDLHTGDIEWGILPAAAPLAISTATIAGMAMAFARRTFEPRRCIVHRRRRRVAWRMARGHQSLRRAAAARRVLHRKQSNGAVHFRLPNSLPCACLRTRLSATASRA